MQTFSDFIHWYRDMLRLTQKQFANHIGVDVTTIQRWEAGISKPNPIHRSQLKRIMKEREWQYMENLL